MYLIKYIMNIYLWCIKMETANLYSDINWFYTNYEIFKEEFRGKVIAINNKEVVISANNIEELKAKAKKKGIDLAQSVIKFIPKEDVILIF